MDITKYTKVIIALALSGLSILFDIIGLAIPQWLVLSVGIYSSSAGLWETCSEGGGNSMCNDLPETFVGKWPFFIHLYNDYKNNNL